VINVLKIPIEPEFHIVNVFQVTMKIMVLLFVKNVDGNVLPVSELLITVLTVKKTESMLKSQIVHVHMI
jgi:hypothetical protein